MARVGGAKGFWDVLKSVSVSEIAREANRPLSVAIVGTREDRPAAVLALFSREKSEAQNYLPRPRALPEPVYVQEFDSFTTESAYPRESNVFDIVISLGSDRDGAPAGTAIYSLTELGGWDGLLERILDDRPELALSLARNLPVFRRAVAQRVIAQTATTNAQWALITGISAAIPITAILLPVNTLSDIVVLTKNQTMMVLRLAAAYGLPVEYRSRMKELGPILANAFGWRAIARELVGVVPGVGFLARAMIAYAGTATVGKAAQLYYETGEIATAGQLRKLYRDAYATSVEKVQKLVELARGGGGGGTRLRIASKSRSGSGTSVADSEPANEEEREPAQA